MRLFAILLLCLAVATCSYPVPHAQVAHPAEARLAGLRDFQLMPPENAVDALPYRSRYPLINAQVRQGLIERGYRESAAPQVRGISFRRAKAGGLAAGWALLISSCSAARGAL